MDQNLKDIILNVKKPLVISNLPIPWKCFGQSFDEWCNVFETENNSGNILCESGRNKYRDEPQWERTREKVQIKIKSVSEQSSTERWIYFGYKDIKVLPSKCRENVDFNFLGFTDLEDITMWLGSTGAHTPCHYDSYGINIVVQVFGKKSWLLFPPGSCLTPTRIPYEESSVYCMENFYSPKEWSNFRDIKDASYHIVINPGDILIVPPKWWHYVENMEPSLNFNTWIPIVSDAENQIEECIVKIVMDVFTNQMASNFKDDIYNPTEDISSDTNSLNLYTVLKALLDSKDSEYKRIKLNQYPIDYLNEKEFNELLQKYENYISTVDKCMEINLKKLIDYNSQRFLSDNDQNLSVADEFLMKKILINSICNPETIKLLKELVIKDRRRRNFN